jgi:predicted membrane metal-binding protein
VKVPVFRYCGVLQFSLIAYSLGILAVIAVPCLAWPLFQIAAALGFTGVIVWRLFCSLCTSAEIHHLLRVGLVGLLFFIGGFSWHVYWGRSGLDARLPSALEGEEITVKGAVISLPRATEFGIQYYFQIEESDFGFTGKVLLNDYGADAGMIRAGQRRNMQVKMKRPHGVANPGGFDREASLLRKGVDATGYVRIVLSVTEATGISLLRLRQYLFDKLNPYTSQSEVGGLVIALVLGVADQIGREQGELFSNTGTSHLFVISGLHVGLVGTGVLAGRFLPASIYQLKFSLAKAKAGNASSYACCHVLRWISRLYAADIESCGDVHCANGCVSYWPKASRIAALAACFGGSAESGSAGTC